MSSTPSPADGSPRWAVPISPRSLATVDPQVPLGAEVRVAWGEPEGGSRKAAVQPHEQFAVRAIVSPAPFSAMAREAYQPGWRSAATV
jgi:vanillate/3-O-methylgallate O-demethylase